MQCIAATASAGTQGGGYGKVISHVIIGLKTVKGVSALRCAAPACRPPAQRLLHRGWALGRGEQAPDLHLPASNSLKSNLLTPARPRCAALRSRTPLPQVKQLKLDPSIHDSLQKERVAPGDVIYIEANSGAVKRVGR